MDYWRRERIGALTGAAAVVFFAIASALVRHYPQQGAPAGAVRAFVIDSRSQLLAQVVLFGIGVFFALWFLGTIRSALTRAEGGAARVASIAHGGGLVSVVVIVLGMLFIGAAAYQPADVDPVTLFRLGQFTTVLTAYPLITFLVATLLVSARSGLLPRVLVALGVVAVGFEALGAVALFSRSGPLSVGSTLSFYVPLAVTLGWMLMTSVVLGDKLGTPVPTTDARRRQGDLWLVPGGVDRRAAAAELRRRAEDTAES